MNKPLPTKPEPGPVARREPPTIVDTLNQMHKEFGKVLPAHVKPETLIRLALTAIRRTPKLAECSTQSFLGALFSAAALGLKPDVGGECYLVPYKSRHHNGQPEAQLIIGYQGYKKLFFQHPLAEYLDAAYVCANDEFAVQKGTSPQLVHKPTLGDRGEIVAYYAVAKLATGATHFEVFTPEQIKRLRGGKEGSSDVPDPEHWMERKTALRQLFKLLPTASEPATATAVDEQPGVAALEQVTAKPVNIDPATGEIE